MIYGWGELAGGSACVRSGPQRTASDRVARSTTVVLIVPAVMEVAPALLFDPNDPAAVATTATGSAMAAAAAGRRAMLGADRTRERLPLAAPSTVQELADGTIGCCWRSGGRVDVSEDVKIDC